MYAQTTYMYIIYISLTDINDDEDTQEQGGVVEDGGTVDTSSQQQDVSQGSEEAEHPEQEDDGEGRTSEVIEAIMADVAPKTTLTQTSGKKKRNRKRGSRGGVRRFERSTWNKKKVR